MSSMMVSSDAKGQCFQLQDFFFSYDYPLWQSVQATLGSSAMQDPWDPANMFVWNEYLTRY